MSNKLASTPQWKWLMQKQRGIEGKRGRELYYTGEVFHVPENEFIEKDGHMVKQGDYPKEMRGNTYRVIGIGNPPSFPLIAAMYKAKQEKKKAEKYRGIDPGPKAKIESSHWKAGHWKVAKVILRRDMDRADNHWMRFGTKSAYRQYKLIEQFLEEKSQQNWDPDDSFATKYLIEYRKAFSDSMNRNLDWTRRREAMATIDLVRSELKIPQYNKL